MKKLRVIEHVVGMAFGQREVLIVGGDKHVPSGDLNSYTLKGAIGSRPVLALDDHVLVQEDNFAKILVMDFTGTLKDELPEGFNLYQALRTGSNRILIPCKTTKSFWLFDENLDKRDLGIYFKVRIILDNLALDYSSTEIIAHRFLEPEIIWRNDVSKFGRNIRKHRDTGEILSDAPNEIDSNLFSYDGVIYVPLKGGQLLALNASDGKKLWLWEHDRPGAFEIAKDKVYKQDGRELFELNAVNGNLIRSKKLAEEDVLEGFHASGPIWIYQDVIIITDLLSGKVCLFNRVSLEVIDFFSIDRKVPFSKNAIVWHRDKLYVLDIENTLHVLTLNK